MKCFFSTGMKTTICVVEVRETVFNFKLAPLARTIVNAVLRGVDPECQNRRGM